MVSSTQVRTMNPFEKLSRRQFQVSALVGFGRSNKDIACRLKVDENTVKVYLSRICEILQVGNRGELELLVWNCLEDFIDAKLENDLKPVRKTRNISGTQSK